MPEGLLKLDRSFLLPAAQMFAEAFTDDPMFVYMLPEPEERRRALPVIFKGMLSVFIASGEVYATSENLEGIVCLSGLNKEKKGSMSLSSIFGMLSMPFSVARRVSLLPMMKRAAAMRRGVSEYRQFKKEFEDSVYIDLIAVAEKHRGRKFMSKMMHTVLSEAAGAGRRCALDTESERNISIYQHFGFKLVKAIDAVPGRLQFNMMVCEPAEGIQHKGTNKESLNKYGV